ncbi:hypothetical protein I6I98_18055 [Sphingobacterium multivorum]|uniref:Uncharacterized protein n=1 Tax=Sphingobacterium multivorum TaxID=28454 RepID=A0ABX7CJI0_SPHMU|nr:hypothetical protein [Sphingobacterium multivorum]QQT52166.1 hypothetical protein I6I98_18055 [Sphingobacterium multivorum]
MKKRTEAAIIPSSWKKNKETTTKTIQKTISIKTAGQDTDLTIGTFALID